VGDRPPTVLERTVALTHRLPDRIVAPLLALAEELRRWADAHPNASLAEHEQAVFERVRATLPTLLEATLTVATPSLHTKQAPPSLACPDCGQRQRVQSWRGRHLQTICGPVKLTRAWYVCQECHGGWSPTDASLKIAAHQRLSAGWHTYLVRLGAATVFREASELLELLTGWPVSPETIRTHTEAAGLADEARQQEAIAQVEQTRASAEPEEAAPGALVVETDGVMVRYLDGWHEVKLGVVGGQVNGHLTEMSFVAAREGPDRFGPRLLTEAARRGALTQVGWDDATAEIATLRDVTILGDGAPWIWNLADEHFATRTEIVDYYHACEHLWHVAKTVLGGETPTAAAWAHTQCDALRDNGVAPVRKALTRLTSTDPTLADILHQERAYFRKNASRMDYPNYRDRGLPIGSGAVESAGKHLVQQRLKRPGARWSEDGAHAVLTLRSHFASQRSPAA
jgi:hypothetical protein